jgi:hypothetical protein
VCAEIVRQLAKADPRRVVREMTSLTVRGLRPAAELGADRPHGDRLRYMAGCRCFQCRRANSDYERQRKAARLAGDWNGLVPANRSRAHLMSLSRVGVGKRAVAAASDVCMTVLQDIRTGKKTQIRARTERRILAVTAAMASDSALVKPGRTFQLIDRLRDEGFTKTELARRLGYANEALQFNPHRMTARNVARVESLYRRLTT